MEIELLYDQGPPVGQYIVGLKTALTNYANNAACIYIGISGTIDERGQAHARRSTNLPSGLSGKGWTRMIAIYNTTTKPDAQEAEKLLIR